MRVPGRLLLVVLGMFVVGCGLPDGRLPQGGPTVLQITRFSALPDNYFPSFSRSVKGAGAIQGLYDAALALPHVQPGGPTHTCPADIGLMYDLRFSRDGRTVQDMDLALSGCWWIEVSKNDVRVPSEAFVSLLARTIGVPESALFARPRCCE